MPSFFHILGARSALALAICMMTAPVASQEEVVHWRMNSLLYPKLFGEAGERFAETVRRLSGGSFVIEVHDRLVVLKKLGVVPYELPAEEIRPALGERPDWGGRILAAVHRCRSRHRRGGQAPLLSRLAAAGHLT